MSETGELYKAIREDQQKKRWDDYDSNKALLIEKGVDFIEKPNGHFIINDKSGKPIYDFWATTGLFIKRKTQSRGRGIEKLLSRLLKGE